MANLTAVLRKTIDGLPGATPQLRAKVYEKARAAITRQIQTADPPLEPHVVEARQRALEDAILETEAHYAGLDRSIGDEEDAVAEYATASSAGPVAGFSEPEPQSQPSLPAPDPEPAAAAPSSEAVAQPTPDRMQERGGASEKLTQPLISRATPTLKPPSQSRDADAEFLSSDAPRSWSSGPRSDVEDGADFQPGGPLPQEGRNVQGRSLDRGIGSLNLRRDAAGQDEEGLSVAADAETNDKRGLGRIPEADLAAPRYTAPRRPAPRRKTPLMAGIVVLAALGLGAAAWAYRDDLGALMEGTQTASVPANVAGTTDMGEPTVPVTSETPESTATPPAGVPADGAAPAATPNAEPPRQFTQRLLPDGSEVDEGQAANAANVFEEGTDVATASLNEPLATPEPEAATSPPAATPAEPSANNASVQQTVPVGQRAVFYEERSADREGTQQDGNVVWSLVNEPPADGQPPEPAIRGVAEIPSRNVRLTMTIRRNADPTLPASHVIELMFDTPSDFVGGQIDNVQRLALKPTEQARGEPLIGVAGKISDGFFIIALNDLPQAISTNRDLLGREEWIDIPLAYSTGQRALISIEKGIPGGRVFKQAMDAWAAKS